MTRFAPHNLDEQIALYEERNVPRVSDFRDYCIADFTGQYLMHWGEDQDLFRFIPQSDKKNHGIYLCRYGQEPVKIEDREFEKGYTRMTWSRPAPDRKYRFK